MKKFNVDELIWFLILTILTAFILYIIKTGEILNFVKIETIYYYYISIGILSLFILVQLEKIFTIRSRKFITNKFIPITFVLFFFVTLFFIIPYYKLSNEKANNLDLDTFYINEEIIMVNNKNYKVIYDIEKNKEKYEGKYIDIVGIVKLDINNEEIVITREEISCCQSDKKIIEMKTKGMNENIKSNCWIRIVGKIHYDNNNWYLDVVQYKEVNEPKDIYFHQ